MITMLTFIIHSILCLCFDRFDFPEWAERFDEFHERVGDFWLGLFD